MDKIKLYGIYRVQANIANKAADKILQEIREKFAIKFGDDVNYNGENYKMGSVIIIDGKLKINILNDDLSRFEHTKLDVGEVKKGLV